LSLLRSAVTPPLSPHALSLFIQSDAPFFSPTLFHTHIHKHTDQIAHRLKIPSQRLATTLITETITGTKDARRTTGLLALGTIPGVIAGLMLQDAIGGLRSLTAAGIGFLITGVVLIVGEKFGRMREARSDDRMTIRHALLIGIAQAVAILPGVSRSGLTISTGRALGMRRSAALDFSFLLAVPIIAGALGKTLLDAWTGDVIFPSSTIALAGFFSSFLVSIAAIHLLRVLVSKRSLAVFAWYLAPLGTTLLVISLIR
jgi:undecaprenyl-diphosphatase